MMNEKEIMTEQQRFTHFPTVREMYPWGQEQRFLKQIRHILRYFLRRTLTYRQGESADSIFESTSALVADVSTAETPFS